VKRDLTAPKRLMSHLVVVVLTGLLVYLGLWQLDRLSDRKELNETIEARYTAEPVSFSELAHLDPEAIEYRRVLLEGVFDPSNEVLIRSQVYLGSAGFHVVTPFIMEGERSILINRGWVPLGFDQAPVAGAPPPSGVAAVMGWVHTSQMRPPAGRVEPDGDLDVLNRVDIERIQSQTPYPLEDVYVVESKGEADTSLPVRAPPPSFDDEGPHFSYAFQWFSFALILIVGYGFLVRRMMRSTIPNRATQDPR
jgi:surfeit locus 1 family protein